MKRARKALIRGLLGLALLAAVLALADPARVAAQLRQAQPGWLLAGLAAGIASNLVSALRWRALAQWLGAPVSARDACRWYFQAIGLNALLPGAVVGGDFYRAVMLRRASHATATVLAPGWSVVLDRVSGLWMLCAIGGLGAAACADVLAPWLRLPAGAFAALMLAGTLLWLALPWALPWLLARSRGGWLAPLRAAAARPDWRRQLIWQALASAAVQVLSALAQKYPLVVISNGNVLLERLGLDGHFQHVLKAGGGFRMKPAPDLFHDMARRLGLPPSQILHVGDDVTTDVAGAVHNGYRSAWLNDVGQDWRTLRILPDVMLTRLEQLLTLL